VLSGRALALVVLAWSLIKVLVGRLFGRKTGLPLFHENYDADGLPALDAAERSFATLDALKLPRPPYDGAPGGPTTRGAAAPTSAVPEP